MLALFCGGPPPPCRGLSDQSEGATSFPRAWLQAALVAPRGGPRLPRGGLGPHPWDPGLTGRSFAVRPPKAAEMRGTLQKQQNRPFRNVPSFSGSHFQGPLDFRPPKAAEMRGTLQKAAKSSISQCSLLFRKPFPGPFRFSGFPVVESCRNEGNPQKQQNRPFRIFRSFSGSHVQGPLDFGFPAAQSCRNEGKEPNKLWA